MISSPAQVAAEVIAEAAVDNKPASPGLIKKMKDLFSQGTSSQPSAFSDQRIPRDIERAMHADGATDPPVARRVIWKGLVELVGIEPATS
jgi:hypothetical protein